MPLPADIHEPETDLVRERAIDHVQCWRRRKECVVIALSLTILAAVLAATTLVLNHQFAAATGTLIGGAILSYVMFVVARICATFARGPAV